MARRTRSEGAARGVKGLSASKGQGFPFAVHDGDVQLQMFRSLADHSQEFIGMCDLGFKPFYVNEAGLRMVGLSSLEEACAVRVQDFFFPEDQHYITEEFFPKVLREGQGEVEIRFRHFKTGAARWMIYNVFQVRDSQGQVSGYATVSRDITERKRAEQALGESEERYRTLFDSMTEGFALHEIITDDQGQAVDYRFLDVNPAFERLTGLKRADLVGRRVREVLPLVEGFWIENYGRVALKGEAVRFENYAQALGRWYEVFAYRPAPRQFAVVFSDITERKRAEEALRESERLYRAIGETIDYGIWVCDPQGRNTYASESFLKLVGMTQQECSEYGWGNVLHPEDAEATIAAWKECVRTGESWYREHRFRGVDGQWHPILACGVPVRNERGDITCWAGINLDISKLKQTEEELRKAKDELSATNANLEDLVAERTAKLHELVGELEHFSYTITHDLKSPLRAMRGFAEIAEVMCGECEHGKAKEFLVRISSAAERMDRLIADALNYSRAVRQELPLEDVDAGALLRGMLDSYPELQPEKARIQVEGRLPVVLANEAALTQCFSNLLGNAVKFVRPAETAEIRVWAEGVKPEARSPKSESEWVRIWVEDRGIGIACEMLPRVFDMFSRGSKSYEGTGIGLALVRKVVQRMGGRVGVESEEGKGSRFWLELKRGEEKAESGGAGAATGAEGGVGTVLYVEDEDSDAVFMERAFAAKGLGASLRLVGDGRAAIDYLSGAGRYADREKYPLPAVVLLDLNLPHVPGFEVLKWMRNHPNFARTPVVVFSSSTREEDRTRAQELGANEFVPKPSSGLKFGELVEGLRGKWHI